MGATASQIARLRRMTGLVGSSDYSDETLAEYIERYSLLDELGSDPYTWDTSTDPPTQEANDGWIPTYDLNAAAGDIWEERAANLAQNYDFRADGGDYSRSQAYEQFMKQARNYRSRRQARTGKLHKYPDEGDTSTQPAWIGNLPEPD